MVAALPARATLRSGGIDTIRLVGPSVQRSLQANVSEGMRRWTPAAQRGMKKGDLSKFIEDAVKWRVLDLTTAEVRSKFADLPAEALEFLIDDAVAAVRETKSTKAG